MTFHTLTSPAKWHKNFFATFQRLNLWLTALLLVALTTITCADEPTQRAFPGFRYVDPSALEAVQVDGGRVVLAADEDFAPWSFRGEDGRLQGISVELAQAACADAKLSCEIRASSFSTLLPLLRSGTVQGIVSGLKPDAAIAAEFALTRPYFSSLGRFVVRTGTSLAAPDIRTLAGRRIGFRANTAHARFLESLYGRSALTPFTNNEAMFEALRTGQVDAIFGDALQMSFWLKGTGSRGCCAYLGKAFVHRETFTRSLAFVLRRDSGDVRSRLDGALDHLESKGIMAEIFARYLPSSVW
jgi:polar amino acid transport system substrate-binding protein